MGLKITGQSNRVAIYPGDIIEIGSSHEIKIDGDISWISYKVSTKMQDGETPEQVHTRVLEFQLKKMEETVQATVQQVQKMGA